MIGPNFDVIQRKSKYIGHVFVLSLQVYLKINCSAARVGNLWKTEKNYIALRYNYTIIKIPLNVFYVKNNLLVHRHAVFSCFNKETANLNFDILFLFMVRL